MKAVVLLLLLVAGGLAEGNLLSLMQDMPYNTAKHLGDRFGEYAAEAAIKTYQLNYDLLMLAPGIDADTTSSLGGAMTGIVTTLAMIALAYFGLSYMFHASGANERNKAKAEMQNMLVLVVLALVAASVFTTVMGIGADLTTMLSKDMTDNSWTRENALIVGESGDVESAFIQNPLVTMVYFFGVSFSAISLSIRWLFLDISRTLFPLFIAFAFIPLDIVKGTGKILLKTMAVFIIIPFIDIALIGSMTTFISNFQSDPVTQVLALSFAFMMVGGINLLLPYMAVQASSLTQMNFMSILSQVRMRAR